jgi:hypothetical protein
MGDELIYWAGFRPSIGEGVSSGPDDWPTEDQGLFIFRQLDAENWYIEHANTGRYLLAPDEVNVKNNCQEGWLNASGTRAADSDYYGLATFKVRVWVSGLFLEHGKSGRYVMATGEASEPGPYTAVNADCNYYDRALWKFIEP